MTDIYDKLLHRFSASSRANTYMAAISSDTRTVELLVWFHSISQHFIELRRIDIPFLILFIF